MNGLTGNGQQKARHCCRALGCGADRSYSEGDSSACFGLGYGPGWVAYFEAGESADRDVLAELADLRGDEVLDGLALFLDEGLLEQADFFVELGHLAFDDLLDDRSRACPWRRSGRGRFPSRGRGLPRVTSSRRM